jgi:hypothetical protein
MFKTIITVSSADRADILRAMERFNSSWSKVAENVNVDFAIIGLCDKIAHGQRWERADGDLVDIISAPGSEDDYPFLGISVTTGGIVDSYTKNGTVWKRSNCERDLARLIDVVTLAVGEYWVDVSGNVHLLCKPLKGRDGDFMSYLNGDRLFFDVNGRCLVMDYPNGNDDQLMNTKQQYQLCGKVVFTAG